MSVCLRYKTQNTNFNSTKQNGITNRSPEIRNRNHVPSLPPVSLTWTPLSTNFAKSSTVSFLPDWNEELNMLKRRLLVIFTEKKCRTLTIFELRSTAEAAKKVAVPFCELIDANRRNKIREIFCAENVVLPLGYEQAAIEEGELTIWVEGEIGGNEELCPSFVYCFFSSRLLIHSRCCSLALLGCG